MKAWCLPLITSALLCAGPQIAQAEDLGDREEVGHGPTEEGAAPAPAEIPTAESLGIIDTEEAVLLLTDTGGVQRATLGSTNLALNEPFLIVRQLQEGLMPLVLESEQRSWEGSIRLYAGQLTRLSAADSLSSPQSTARSAEEFDLFDFYDQMDQLFSMEEKLSRCEKIQAAPPPPPDDELVSDLCDRLQKQAELEEELKEEELKEVDDDLSVDLLDAPEEEAERRLAELQKLYRADGRLRKNPKGTPIRLSLTALGFVGSAAGVASGLHFEVQAEQEYLLYREAERVGDDPAMTRHLFVTQQYDRRRNTAFGLAAASLTGGIVAALIQRLESRRFQRYRASIKDGEDTPND